MHENTTRRHSIPVVLKNHDSPLAFKQLCRHSPDFIQFNYILRGKVQELTQSFKFDCSEASLANRNTEDKGILC